jgi:radical SAM superfamily enzyme YgiQ (UPF0313 family)
MDKISLVNPNFQQGPRELNAHYLPYSVGILWEYARLEPVVRDNLEVNAWIWQREPHEKVLDDLRDDVIVGFSAYLWNWNYNLELARKLKLQNPDVLIVFGGPQPPIEDPDFFQKFPYIDICVKTEGEHSLRNILKEYYTFKNYQGITGLLINDDGKVLDTGPAERISDLDEIPSPYLSGLFDHLVTENPDVQFTAILETNRGCPYQCTFCDWGSLTYAKVKKFNLERVFAELEWMGRNQIDFISITDANFGMFIERDLLIAKKIVEVQKKYDNPKSYTMSWAKNQRAEVLEIVKTLMFEGGSTLGLNLSVQTLDENTLEIIKRKNLKMNKVEEIFEDCELNNIPLYTELILGLPGETPETWRNNFYKLYEAKNHTGITVYQAQLLENAEMNLRQMEEYDIVGVPVYDYLVGAYNDDELRECINVVASTSTMPLSEMLKAAQFSWFQISFHINGLSTYLARFVNKYMGESYKDFYEKLWAFIEMDPWLKSEIDRIEYYFNNWLQNGVIEHPPISGMEIHGWNLIHSTTIQMHSCGKNTHVVNVMEEFMRETYSSIDPELMETILDFQGNYIVDSSNLQSYPRYMDSKYDILGYLQGTNELTDSTTYRFEFPENPDMSLEMFCEKIFFDRRKNFGKAWVYKQ